MIQTKKGHLNLGDSDEVQFSSIYLSPIEYPSAIELVARKLVDVKGLVTHHFRLVEFERALKTLDDPSTKALKVVITR